LVVEAEPELTLESEPTTVTGGDYFDISGTLVGVNGNPLIGVSVSLWVDGAFDRVLGSTDGWGFYSYRMTVPTDAAPDTYILRTRFQGAQVSAITYQETLSPEVAVQVDPP